MMAFRGEEYLWWQVAEYRLRQLHDQEPGEGDLSRGGRPVQRDVSGTATRRKGRLGFLSLSVGSNR